MNSNPNLKGRSEHARSVYLRGLLGTQAGLGASTSPATPTPMPTAAPPSPSPQGKAPQYDLRTFKPDDLGAEGEWEEEEAQEQTVDMESVHSRLVVLKAAIDDLGVFVLPIAIGALVRVAIRLTGDSRIVLICICTAVLLAAVICVVVVPYKKRLPIVILFSLAGIWVGGIL